MPYVLWVCNTKLGGELFHEFEWHREEGFSPVLIEGKQKKAGAIAGLSYAPRLSSE